MTDSSTSTSIETASPRAIAVALFSVYVAWGATYVAIAVAVRTLPPLLMAGVRFTTAGALLLAVLRLRGEPMPTGANLRASAITGGLMLGVGNGLVCLVSGSVSSSLIALVIALTPLCIASIAFVVTRERPRPVTWVSIALGLCGVFVLVGTPDRRSLASHAEVAMILGAIIAWSIGSVLARKLPLPSSSSMTTATQMLLGGLMLLVSGVIAGELPRTDLAHASLESLVAFGYLTIIGSMIGYGAYAFLLKHTEPAVATSYAYVNPLIALVLGHLIADEPIDARTIIAAGIIISAVVLLVRSSTTRAAR